MKSRQLLSACMALLAGSLGIISVVEADRSTFDFETIVCLVNRARAENCLPPVGVDHRLNAAAFYHSQYQYSIKSMQHEGEGGSKVDDRVNKYGWHGKWSSVGECVAVDWITPLSLVLAWLDSPDHRPIILGDYTQAGFASVGTPPPLGHIYSTLDFAKANDNRKIIMPHCENALYNSLPVVDIFLDKRSKSCDANRNPISPPEKSLLVPAVAKLDSSAIKQLKLGHLEDLIPQFGNIRLGTASAAQNEDKKPRKPAKSPAPAPSSEQRVVLMQAEEKPRQATVAAAPTSAPASAPASSARDPNKPCDQTAASGSNDVKAYSAPSPPPPPPPAVRAKKHCPARRRRFARK